MQVYQHNLDSYQLYQVDKYYGRKINSESGLKRELEVCLIVSQRLQLIITFAFTHYFALNYRSISKVEQF